MRFGRQVGPKEEIFHSLLGYELGGRGGGSACRLSVKIFDLCQFSLNLSLCGKKQVNYSYSLCNSHNLNCMQGIQTNETTIYLPLSCHCPSMTAAKFSHLPVEDFVRRNSFNENAPIAYWRACFFNAKNSVRCFFNSKTPLCFDMSTGTRLPFREKPTITFIIPLMTRPRGETTYRQWKYCSTTGHFPIAFGLFFKASPGAHPFIWKLGFIWMWIKINFHMKG